MANHEEPFICPSQAQQVFFVDKDHNPQWKFILHKESISTCCAKDSIIDSNNIDDYASWLNTPLLTPPPKPSRGQIVIHKRFSNCR
jgi:hypothetical protein